MVWSERVAMQEQGIQIGFNIMTGSQILAAPVFEEDGIIMSLASLSNELVGEYNKTKLGKYIKSRRSRHGRTKTCCRFSDTVNWTRSARKSQLRFPPIAKASITSIYHVTMARSVGRVPARV